MVEQPKQHEEASRKPPAVVCSFGSGRLATVTVEPITNRIQDPPLSSRQKKRKRAASARIDFSSPTGKRKQYSVRAKRIDYVQVNQRLKLGGPGGGA